MSADTPNGEPSPLVGAPRHGLEALHAALARKDEVIVELAGRLAALEKNGAWRAFRRAVRICDRVPGLRAAGSALEVTHRAVRVLLGEGPATVAQRIQGRVVRSLGGEARRPGGGTGRVRRDLALGSADRGQVPRGDSAVPTADVTTPGPPRISLIIPVLDATDLKDLDRTLSSACAQRYRPWELWLAVSGGVRGDVEALAVRRGEMADRIFVKPVGNSACPVGVCELLESAAGDFVGFLDAGDELAPDALQALARHLQEDPERDIVYSDEEQVDAAGTGWQPVLKPDWSPDLLMAYNYLGQLTLVRRQLLVEMGACCHGPLGAHHYDLFLRATERARRIGHAREILCRVPERNAGDGAWVPRVVAAALARRGLEGSVRLTASGHLDVRYRIRAQPRVSIVIATCDKGPILRQCLESIEEKTTYNNYELVVIDHDTADAGTLAYLSSVGRRWPVHRWSGRFNFSAISNFGAARATGDYLLFLNNDTRVIAPDWLEAMLAHAQRSEVGAVGAKLLYADGRIQHAGVAIGFGGPARHAVRMEPGTGRRGLSADVVRNCSAVTGACMMVARPRFAELGGFDERFRVAFSDIDLCLRLRARDYRIVYTPAALLYHYESVTRGRWDPPADVRLFSRRWAELIRAGDPYLSTNVLGR